MIISTLFKFIVSVICLTITGLFLYMLTDDYKFQTKCAGPSDWTDETADFCANELIK